MAVSHRLVLDGGAVRSQLGRSVRRSRRNTGLVTGLSAVGWLGIEVGVLGGVDVVGIRHPHRGGVVGPEGEAAVDAVEARLAVAEARVAAAKQARVTIASRWCHIGVTLETFSQVHYDDPEALERTRDHASLQMFTNTRVRVSARVPLSSQG
eukprot:1186697-Prorocentrum_minimum.AAC.1